MHKKFWLKKIIGFGILGIAAVALFGFIVMSLWNSVLVAVLPVATISFWQAMGILVLSKILFGGFLGGCSGHRAGRWKNEMKEKWQGMNEEEREKMKQEWRNRCRVWKQPDADVLKGTE